MTARDLPERPSHVTDEEWNRYVAQTDRIASKGSRDYDVLREPSWMREQPKPADLQSIDDKLASVCSYLYFFTVVLIIAMFLQGCAGLVQLLDSL